MYGIYIYIHIYIYGIYMYDIYIHSIYMLNETILTYGWKRDAGLRLPSSGMLRYDVGRIFTNQRHISKDYRSENLQN
jgi:hypothetical protein